MIFLASFLLGLLGPSSLTSSLPLAAVDDVDMADGGLMLFLPGGGIAREAEEAVRLMLGTLAEVGRRDMLIGGKRWSCRLDDFEVSRGLTGGFVDMSAFLRSFFHVAPSRRTLPTLLHHAPSFLDHTHLYP